TSRAHGLAGGLRLAARVDRRRALRPAGRGVARDARVLPRTRGDHATADRRARVYGRRRRGGLAGRVPRQLLRPGRRSRRGARRARRRYVCLEQFGPDALAYGLRAADDCEDEVVAQLRELEQRAAELAARDGRIEEDRVFYAEQNARLVRNAERYYRAMYRGR